MEKSCWGRKRAKKKERKDKKSEVERVQLFFVITLFPLLLNLVSFSLFLPFSHSLSLFNNSASSFSSNYMKERGSETDEFLVNITEFSFCFFFLLLSPSFLLSYSFSSLSLFFMKIHCIRLSELFLSICSSFPFCYFLFLFSFFLFPEKFFFFSYSRNIFFCLSLFLVAIKISFSMC